MKQQLDSLIHKVGQCLYSHSYQKPPKYSSLSGSISETRYKRPLYTIFMNTKCTRETLNGLKTDFCTYRALDFLQILYWEMNNFLAEGLVS